MINIVGKLAKELSLQEYQVNNVVKLLFEEQCTIPFVARYRKEMHGSLDEVKLKDIRDRYNYVQELETNKAKYLKVVEEFCKKKPELMKQWPELKRKFEACETKQELEDLYLPYKPKRRTRAQIAREKGLEPLLEKLLTEGAKIFDLVAIAKDFITPADATIDPALRVNNEKEALAGAADILAETVAETAEIRALVREISFATGYLVSKKVEGPEGTEDAPTPVATPYTGAPKKEVGKKVDATKYENYYDYREPVKTCPPHRVMAVRRGEAEKVLRVTIDVDVDQILSAMKAAVMKDRLVSDPVRAWIELTTEDAYRRLLGPSIETEIRLELKNGGEAEAIRVFSDNLANLLLLPPIPGKVVLGVDPGLRTGCKFAVVDETGKLLTHTTLYTDFGDKEGSKTENAKREIARLIKTFKVQCLAIGNGTGSREISKIIADAMKENGITDVKRLVVNEAGASVYSTDDVAREEFPDLDPTIRSTVSIARRLQDPLAELVKIDPRSIGVGQYQHDVNVTKLKGSLEEVVETCVNRVGVNVNTASYKLLNYVSGIGSTLAKSIVNFRDQHGKFKSRDQLLKVPGFGPKAFEQAAGFLRVPESANPLDNSSVHPERYDIVSKVATDQQKSIEDLVGNKTLVESIAWDKYVSELVGMPTLQDIASELIKPGRDPREDGTRLMFSDDVNDLSDLKIGMVLPGTVTNVTNFGAFVDIGVHQDGLIHISELSEKFVDDPSKVVSVGDVLQVKVIDVDIKRRRISLSKRLEGAKPKSPADNNAPQQAGQRPQGQKPGASRSAPPPKGGRPAAPQPNYSVQDLLSKFNQRR